MTLKDSKLDHLLNESTPIWIDDEDVVRDAVSRSVGGYTRQPSRRRAAVIGSLVGGLVVVGTTAAALPSIFEGFGPVDYQSVQQYTVDDKGPFRCEFGFRVEPPAHGIVVGPAGGMPSPQFEEIQQFVQTHDWHFDDEPVALVTPANAQGQHQDIGVMSDYISASWKAELELAYPNWMAAVGGVSETGQCVKVSEGTAP